MAQEATTQTQQESSFLAGLSQQERDELAQALKGALMRFPDRAMAAIEETAKEREVELNGKAQALYLAPPHGSLIAQGEKSAIVKAQPLDLEGDWMLVSGPFLLGRILIGQREMLPVPSFQSRFDEHRVTEKERRKWWPDHDYLWFYPVEEMSALDEPVGIILPPGTKTFLQEVETKGGEGSGWFGPPKGTHGPGSQSGRITPQGQAQEDMVQYLKDHAALLTPHKPEGWKYASLPELLLDKGQFNTPQPLPEKYEDDRGLQRECYRNAAMAVIRNDELTYVEGYAVGPGIGIAVQHAWAVDSGGNVIEVTWPEPGDSYIGVRFDRQFLMEQLVETETYGLFQEHYSRDPDTWNPLRDGIPEEAVKGGPGSGWYGPPKGTHGPGSQGGRGKARARAVHRWSETKPWAASKQDVIDGKVPGVVYDGSMRASASAYDPKGIGEVKVGPSHFTADEEGRRMEFYHEAGHFLSGRALQEDSRFIQAIEPFRQDTGKRTIHSVYDNFAGLSGRPEEFLADVYTALIHNQASTYETSKYLDVFDTVAGIAQEMGLPSSPLFEFRDGQFVEIGQKGGEGSGWFGPPKGTHGAGSQGGRRLEFSKMTVEERDEAVRNLRPNDTIRVFHGMRYLEDIQKTAEEGFDPSPEKHERGRVYGGHQAAELFEQGGYHVSPIAETAQGFGSHVFEFDVQARSLISPPHTRWGERGTYMSHEETDKFWEDIYPNSFSPALSQALMGGERQGLLIRPVPASRIIRVWHWEPIEGEWVSQSAAEVAEDIRTGRVKSLAEKGGPGSGWYGPPKGTHGPGSQGGTDIGPFGKDQALYEKAREHFRRTPDGYSMKHPGDIYRAEQGAQKRLREKNLQVAYERSPEGKYIPITVTEEQAQFVVDEISMERMRREAWAQEQMGLPDTYQEFLEGVPYIEKQLAWDTGPEGLAMWEALGERMAKQLEGVDLSGLHGSDIFHGILDRYEQQAIADFGEDSVEAKNIHSWLFDAGRRFDQEHEFQVRHEIALGNITPEEASALDVYGAANPQGKEWTDLPDVLYHVTTNAGAVQADQIRSRRELGMRFGAGLGGGEDDTISFTTDLATARNIERAIHEAHRVARGDISIADMVEAARRGGGGVGRPWVDDLDEMMTTHIAPLSELLAAERGDPGVRERLLTNMDERRFNFYKSYQWARQMAGGYENPVFFGTDWQALARMNPDQFAILRYTPRQGSRGYLMGGLGEWRTVGGDTVDLEEVIDWVEAGDLDILLGTDDMGEGGE